MPTSSNFMCAANNRASSVCAMFDLGVVAVSTGALADWIAALKRFGDCETWEDLFLGMDTDATCAVVVVVAVKKEGVPEEPGTGAFGDCATVAAGLRDCDTWRAPFWKFDRDATCTDVEVAVGNNKEGFAGAGMEGPENVEVLCVLGSCVAAPNEVRDWEPD